MSDPREALRKRAKELKKAARDGDAAAAMRVSAVLRVPPARVTHMQALHAVSVEAGFAKWQSVLDASDDEVRAAVQRTRPTQRGETE